LPDSWTLKKDGRALATLRLTNTDQPFFYCALSREAAFAEYEALFASLQELVKNDDFRELENRLQAIVKKGFTLEPGDGGQPIREFLLHIDGDVAWFRY
jgi:hypothetical protein